LRPGAPQNRRILVVDDDRAIAEELRGSLRVAGFDAEAVSLAAGLTPEFILRLAPGLVLLDAAAGGFRAETVRAIVLGLRARLGCRLLLMGEPGPALEEDDDQIWAFTSQVIAPIIAEGDPIGAVILGTRDPDKKMGELELKLAETAAGFLAKQMEQ